MDQHFRYLRQFLQQFGFHFMRDSMTFANSEIAHY